MANFSEVLKIDPNILESRFRFLSARVKWHIRQSEAPRRTAPGSAVMHLACAATLERDAGAIALILGRAESARSRFMSAGHLRLRLGFYDGLYLLRLGETDSGEGRTLPDDVPAWLERSLSGGEREVEGLPQFAATASRSPRQLVSILQAAGAWNKTLEGATALASNRLRVYSAYPLGVTQIPVERYLKLLRELQGGYLESSRRTLIAMSLQREELITAAQSDQFHWRLAQKPANLIDMDLLALGLVALDRKQKLFEEVHHIAGEFGPTASIPFDAVRLLRAPNSIGGFDLGR